MANLLRARTGARGAAAPGTGENLAHSPIAASEFSNGMAAYTSGDYHLAARCFNAVIEAQHDAADAHYYLGLAYLKLNQVEDAVDCFVMAAHFRPDFAEAHHGLALVAQRRGEHREAASELRQAISSRADYAEAYNALGASVLELGNPQEAVANFEHAIALKSDFAYAHNNLGYVLFRDLGEHERGAAHIKTALDLNHSDPGIWCNQSMVLMHQGRIEDAIQVCDRLLASNPELHEARLNRALAKLKLGRFAEAWPDYEARKLSRSNYIARPFGFREWQGDPLTGKTVLVYAEQGIGDEIMFASCLREVVARAGKCVIECAPRLEGLMRRSFPEQTVHGTEQSEAAPDWLTHVGRVDFQVASGSLPGFFRRLETHFPRHGGYLRADPASVERWRMRLCKLGGGARIGISWKGGTTSTRKQLRSIALAELLPFLRRKDTVFVSLQYGACGPEIEALLQASGVRVHHWQEAIDDYDETAALVSALDLVISVQTAVVHLAGALGKPVWVMVPAVAEWRYLQSGETMPWYPSVRLFRQSRADDWGPVIDSVAAELGQLAPS
ncbi:MAG TPA: tetratricopeptide repeat-containing glycosyltransferase family protein [Burkholderiales bacterium]|nr:tetratricopeptide repeat-containing glycosyltransferase family protein [Burkholderiales bacterium]